MAARVVNQPAAVAALAVAARVKAVAVARAIAPPPPAAVRRGVEGSMASSRRSRGTVQREAPSRAQLPPPGTLCLKSWTACSCQRQPRALRASAPKAGAGAGAGAGVAPQTGPWQPWARVAAWSAGLRSWSGSRRQPWQQLRQRGGRERRLPTLPSWGPLGWQRARRRRTGPSSSRSPRRGSGHAWSRPLPPGHQHPQHQWCHDGMVALGL